MNTVVVHLDHRILNTDGTENEILSPPNNVDSNGGGLTLTSSALLNEDNAGVGNEELSVFPNVYSEQVTGIEDLNVTFSSPINATGVMTEPGEVVDIIQPPTSPSPPPSPASISPTPTYSTSYHHHNNNTQHHHHINHHQQQQQQHHSQPHSNRIVSSSSTSSYSGAQTPTGIGYGSGSGSSVALQQSGHSSSTNNNSSNSVSSSSANSSSQVISSDHCYGLPYQDHNYGSTMSPALGIRVSHTRNSSHHAQQQAAPSSSAATSSSLSSSSSVVAHHMPPRAKITVKATPTAFPSLAGPPPLERNSCSDEESNVVDPLLYTQPTAAESTGDSSPTFLSPILPSGSAASSIIGGGIYKTASGVTVMPTGGGGITVCSTSAAAAGKPRIRRVVLEDSSHTYASVAGGVIDATVGQQATAAVVGGSSTSSMVKPKHITIFAAGSAGANSHPQKVAVFRRLTGGGVGQSYADTAGSATNAAFQINGSLLGAATQGLIGGNNSINPPTLVSTSSTGAPTFSGAILGPGLMAPIIPVGNIGAAGEPIPPPKRPGRPRGARAGGQTQQQQQTNQQPRAPRQIKPRSKKQQQTLRPQMEGGGIPTHPPLIAPAPGPVMAPAAPQQLQVSSSPPPAAAHESVVPASLACLLPAAIVPMPSCGGLGEVDQSIESVLQSVSSAACIESLLHQQYRPTTTAVVFNQEQQQQQDLTRKKPIPSSASAAAAADSNFAESYKSLYERLFKQLGEVPDDEDVVDLDKPVGASRQREPYVRFTPKKSKSSSSTVENQPISSTSTTMAESPKSAGASNTDTDESSADEWAGQDYTTRCVCALTHNDDFMIQCDRCECWQHCDCLGLQKKSVPDKYLCELCEPRSMKLTKEEAQKLQMKKLQKMKRQKSGRKRLSSSTGSTSAVGRGRPRKNTGESSTSSSAAKKPQRKTKQQQLQDQADEDLYASFLHMEVNEYTSEVLKAIRLCGDSIGATLLEQLPDPPPCLVMYVTKERRGLVANKTIPPDQPVIEIRGKIATTMEFNGRDKSGRLFPCVLFYRSLPKGGGVDGSSPLDLCVDARYRGTEARFLRRSCQPNAQVKHVIKDGQLHLLLIATEVIESATELTIPFDYDYRHCYAIECACKIWGNGECPIDRYNSMQSKNTASSSSNSGGGTTSGSSSSSVVKRGLKKMKRAAPNSLSKQRRKQQQTTLGMKKNKLAIKKSVGFKVKLKDRKNAVAIGRKFGKKKLKPVASVDLTRRRSSAAESAPPESPMEATTSPASPPPAPIKQPKKEEELFTSSEVSRSSLSSPTVVVAPRQISTSRSVSFSAADDLLASPTVDGSGHSLSREEKKMQHLVEQIARMEEREKKKVEKRNAKVKEDDKIKKEPGLAETKNNDESTGPKTENVDQKTDEQPKKKRGRRPSVNKNNNSSSSLNRSRSDSQSSPTTEMKTETFVVTDARETMVDTSSIVSSSLTMSPKQRESFGWENAANVRKNSMVDVERNVAKKRWLRQAMSEESGTLTSTMISPTIEMKGLPELLMDSSSVASASTVAPLSPPTAPPLKKRRLTNQNNADSLDTTPVVVPSLQTSLSESSGNVIISSSDEISEVPSLSTTEAAELLTSLMQQNNNNSNNSSAVVQQETTTNVSGIIIPPEIELFHEEGISDSDVATSTPTTAVAEQRAGTPVLDEVDVPQQREQESTTLIGFTPMLTSSYESGVTVADVASVIWDKNVGAGYGALKSSLRTSQYAPPPAKPKKVKISFDEYKKRKRDTVSVDGSEIPTTATIVDATNEERSRDSSDSSTASAPVTPLPPPTTTTAATTSASQRSTTSFIPQIKEGDLETKTIRLGSIPDPRFIGKTSATLDELRQRIYGRSYPATKKFDAHDQTAEIPTTTNSEPTTHQTNVVTNVESFQQQQQQTSANVATNNNAPPSAEFDLESAAPTHHRMSLMDRLRMEFGL